MQIGLGSLASRKLISNGFAVSVIVLLCFVLSCFVVFCCVLFCCVVFCFVLFCFVFVLMAALAHVLTLP